MRDVFAIKMLALVFDAALLFYTFVAAFVVDRDETGGEERGGGRGSWCVGSMIETVVEDIYLD